MDTLCDHMGDFFPELISQQELIMKVIKEEEQSFLRTLSEGLKKLDVIMKEDMKQDEFISKLTEVGVSEVVLVASKSDVDY